MDAVTGLFQPIGEQGGAAPCGSVKKKKKRGGGGGFFFFYIERGGARGGGGGAGGRKRKKHKRGFSLQREIVRTDTAYQGEIVILPSDSVRLNDVLGDQTRLPRKRWREDPPPCCGRRLRRKRQRKENGCWTLLRNLRILTRFCVAKWIPSPMRSFFLFLGRVQLEVVSALLSEKYKLETVVKEPSVIYMERPLKAASHTHPYRGAAQPVLGIHRTVCYTTLAWLRCTIREPGFAGILEPEFSKRCQGWYPLRAGAGLVRLERNGL